MDRFCVSGPSFPTSGGLAAAVQNLSHKPFFFSSSRNPIATIMVWRFMLPKLLHRCVESKRRSRKPVSPGDVGRIKGDQRRSGSKNLWFRFFSFYFIFPSLSHNPKRKVLISKCLWFKLRLSQNVDLIDARIVFWHVICIRDS